MIYKADAPSNIALIKYMGKAEGNIPLNSSLSYSLENLRTFVELEENERERWEPLNKTGLISTFPPLAIEKYLLFFKKLKEKFQIKQNFIIRSANNFHSDCGLASSASSFAALTKAFSLLTEKSFEKDPQFWSSISREGSGSSCRSFFSPWALWSEKKCTSSPIELSNLQHLAIIVSAEQKKVSSSEAHQRVKTSLLLQDRPQRAEARLTHLIHALNTKKWETCFETVWNEFWDMHALFETSNPSFSYFTPDSIFVLNTCRKLWKEDRDGPLVTMDAGANIHLLFRDDQTGLLQKYQKTFHSYAQI